MEEILASIRRIIEDSDGVAPKPPAADPADAELATFRAELAQDMELPAAPPQTGADVKAGIESPDRSAASGFSAAGFDAGRAPVQRDVEIAPRPAPATEHSVFATVEPIERDDETTAEEAAPRLSILSDAASRQVAASFGELSDAFSASRRRSFDEIAEEMLRPMLQDWLDNNLPVLVERLVREEIERVARGGSR